MPAEEVLQQKEGAARLRRPRMTVQFPPGVRMMEQDPKEVVLQQLTLSQEHDAAKVGTSNDAKLWEQIKRALVSVDGRAPDAGRAEVDVVVENLSAPARRYLEGAWLRFTYPSEALDPLLAAHTRIEV